MASQGGLDVVAREETILVWLQGRKALKCCSKSSGRIVLGTGWLIADHRHAIISPED